MYIQARKPLFKKHIVKKRKTPEERFIQRRMKKIKVKNPATDNEVSLWSYRIRSPRALRKMTSSNRRAFELLHKKFKKEMKRTQKLWNTRHGLNKKAKERATKLPEHLLTRHNLLIKQYRNHKIDMGEGPRRVKDLVKIKDPEEYAKTIQAIDKLHKKERRQLLRKYADEPMVVNGKTTTVRDALKHSLKTGDRKAFLAVLKMSKTLATVDRHEQKMSTGERVGKATRLVGVIKKVMKNAFKASSHAEKTKGKKGDDKLFEEWEKNKADFQKELKQLQALIDDVKAGRVTPVKDEDTEESTDEKDTKKSKGKKDKDDTEDAPRPKAKVGIFGKAFRLLARVGGTAGKGLVAAGKAAKNVYQWKRSMEAAVILPEINVLADTLHVAPARMNKAFNQAVMDAVRYGVSGIISADNIKVLTRTEDLPTGTVTYPSNMTFTGQIMLTTSKRNRNNVVLSIPSFLASTIGKNVTEVAKALTSDLLPAIVEQVYVVEDMHWGFDVEDAITSLVKYDDLDRWFNNMGSMDWKPVFDEIKLNAKPKADSVVVNVRIRATAELG